MKEKGMTRRSVEMLLAAVITARATSYLFSKLIMNSMGMFNLLGIRFLLAFFLMTLVFFRRIKTMDRASFLAGVLMGGIYFLVMTAELSGLKRTSTGNVAFLENTAIVIVPLMQALLSRRFPRWTAVIGATVSLVGIGFLTISTGLRFGPGEAFCMLAAVLYAGAIVLTDRLTHGSIDAFNAGVVQVGTIGMLGMIASLLFETPRLPVGLPEWGGVLMLAIVCTGFGFTLQPVAQRGTTAERAGVLCALNPFVAAVLGAAFLKESFTAQSVLGGGLILAGILISEQQASKRKEKILAT